MCGISGFLSSQFSKNDLENMTNRLAHRGPDAGGYFFDEAAHIGLGHRRLSIIDLSDAANQPFYSRCGRYQMVFNGEVYNFQEVKKLLPNKNWKTNGDTEVIIEAFAAWGTACFEKLNGMFALAIWDSQEQQLFLCRDRLGIKPLYYYWDGKNFAFASELKAIRALFPSLPIFQPAIANYLYLGYVPDNQTFFQHVHKLPAGHIGALAAQDFSISSYWKAEEKVKPQTLTSWEDAKKQLTSLLQSSISYRLISDVPFGAFLSGGTDSSIVTAFAQEATNAPLKTFSIGFKEAKFNESEYARKVAEHLKTDHHEFILSEDDALGLVPKILSMHDQPFADSSAVPTFLVSEMARKHVTVALSGDGGDELFMGYGMYNWARRLNQPLVKAASPAIAWALNLSGKSRLQRAATVFSYTNPARIKSHIFSQEQYLFNEIEIQQLLLPNQHKSIELIEDFATSRNLTAEEAQALFDIKHYLKDDLLVKVDIASMQNSLEVRVPLLDHRIVEFALNLHQSLKINQQGTQKHLLKEVLYDRVPRSLFDRPKWGFSIPLIHWLKGPLRGLIDTYLSETVVTEVGVVNYQIVKQLKADFFGGKDYLYNRLWSLILLHQFFKEFESVIA